MAEHIVAGREEELRIVAQHLAYIGLGVAKSSDIVSAHKLPTAESIRSLLDDAYRDEEDGKPEGYRRGPFVDVATIHAMLRDPECHWLCAEAVDDLVLGVACYSFSDSVATLRFLGIQRRFRGLCVGTRLLRRVEEAAAARQAKALLACVPSPRKSMTQWVERRGFKPLDHVPFPSDLSFTVLKPDAHLVVYAKDLSPLLSCRRSLVVEDYDQVD